MTDHHTKDYYLRLYIVIIAVFFVLSGLLFWIANEQMEAVKSQTTMVTPAYSDGGLYGTNVLEQRFTVHTDTLDQILLYIGTFGRENNSEFTLQLLEGTDVVWEHGYLAKDLSDLKANAFMLENPLEGVKEHILTLRILTFDVPADQCVSFFFGNTYSASRTEVSASIEAPLTINGSTVDGALCFSLIGRDYLLIKDAYWPAVFLLTIAGSVFYLISYHVYMKNGKGFFAKAAKLNRYSFLMQQLVARDFKIKYKRSVLGVLWSFLNPLLTMGVQYLIFSSLFQSGIENFAVYLMTGGVIFNFFSEASSLGLTSIVANAPLITKVYVPKYIYPVSRVLSSLVNVGISMIPLLLLIAFSGIPFTKAILLLPAVLLLTAVFSVGMSLVLSSLMVFFRDIQFLWGVISMLWMYMTPIFYPDSIIPHQFITIYHMNPMYQYIRFLRDITMRGEAPNPINFAYCVAASLVMLGVGILVFRKTQDKFVFYL